MHHFDAPPIVHRYRLVTGRVTNNTDISVSGWVVSPGEAVQTDHQEQLGGLSDVPHALVSRGCSRYP